MINLLKICLLRFSIILLSGYGFCAVVPSRTMPKSVAAASFVHPIIKNTGFTESRNFLNAVLFVSGQNEIVKINREKDEEESGNLIVFHTDKPVSSFNIRFYSQHSKRLLTGLKMCFTSRKHWFYNASDRYIAIRSIRV